MLSGSIFLEASLTKTQRSRNAPLAHNLKAWLTRYLPETGTLLPPGWGGMERLDQLPEYASKRSGVPWVRNAP
jgi:hypothetical protein